MKASQPLLLITIKLNRERSVSLQYLLPLSFSLTSLLPPLLPNHQMSMDSGLGVSDNGQVWTNRQHHSGSETHQRAPIKMDKVMYSFQYTCINIPNFTLLL